VDQLELWTEPYSTYFEFCHKPVPGHLVDPPMDLLGVVHQSVVKIKAIYIHVFEGQLTIGEHGMLIGPSF